LFRLCGKGGEVNKIYIYIIMKRTIFNLLAIGFLSLIFCNCSSTKAINGQSDYSKRRLLLRDEAISQLSYVDFADSTKNWYMPVPTGRDLQLVGNGRVLIGTGNGYEEREIATGKKVNELTSYAGTISARKLKNGNVLLAGVNWQGKKGIALVEVNAGGTVQRIISYPEFNYVRLIRETSSNTFLVTADDIVFEGDAAGNILWKVKIESAVPPHAWQAVRLADKRVVISGGYSKNLQLFSATGKLEATIGGPPEVNPNFYGGFQVLENGNYVVTNWQGHGPGHGAQGIQLLEYDQQGKLVWSWKQDAEKYSSLQGVIVLDGLDTRLMYTENEKGVLGVVKL
jgi:hypothetical protein